MKNETLPGAGAAVFHVACQGIPVGGTLDPYLVGKPGQKLYE